VDGIKATRLIRKVLPQMKILSLSQYDIPKVVSEVEKADAAAFGSKLLVRDKLVLSLRRVQFRETFFS
jgi:DNA-binding NarL/FixJ family response regulator